MARDHTRSMIDLDRLEQMLVDRIDSLVPELLPNGGREGAEWVAPSIEGTSTRSLSVHMKGGKVGVWTDFALHSAGLRDGYAGGLLGLIAYVKFGRQIKPAIGWAKSWLGIADDASWQAALRQPPSRTRETRARDSQMEDERKRSAAKSIWARQAAPLTFDDIAGTYLFNRAIDLRSFPRVPAALRFHPELRHMSGLSFPALVGAIHRGGEMVGVHRIWLSWDGAGKAHLPLGRDGKPGKAKMALGPYAGGCIRLWRGGSGTRLADCPPDDTVMVCEGIEDGLSVALLRPDARVLVAISLANMAAIELPAQLRAVTLVADNDADPRARESFARAVAAHQSAGRRVNIARSAVGKDFNDWLQALAAEKRGVA